MQLHMAHTRTGTHYCMGISARKFKVLVASGPNVLCFGHQANNFIRCKIRCCVYVSEVQVL